MPLPAAAAADTKCSTDSVQMDGQRFGGQAVPVLMTLHLHTSSNMQEVYTAAAAATA
jgi:hypothetical protein